MKRPLRLDVLLIVVVPLIDLLGVAVALAAENGNFAGLVDHRQWPQDVSEM